MTSRSSSHGLKIEDWDFICSGDISGDGLVRPCPCFGNGSICHLPEFISEGSACPVMVKYIPELCPIDDLIFRDYDDDPLGLSDNDRTKILNEDVIALALKISKEKRNLPIGDE